MAVQKFYTPELPNFRNTFYSLNTRIMKHFSDMLFRGDTKRIVYSSTDFAFRQRAKVTEFNNLNFPFMNFKISGINIGTTRSWWNSRLNTSGIFIEELKRSMYVTPVTVSYQSSVFFQSNEDALYAYSQLLWDDSQETLIDYYITIDGVTLKIIGILEFNLEFDPTYDRSDWLEKNNIHSITIDFSLQTFIIKDNTDISIPEEVLLQFNALTSDSEEIASLEEIYDTMTVYFTDPTE